MFKDTRRENNLIIKDFKTNDARIKFTLNFINMMNLIIVKLDHCEKNSDGV